jgi:hypothetical protein
MVRNGIIRFIVFSVWVYEKRPSFGFWFDEKNAQLQLVNFYIRCAGFVATGMNSNHELQEAYRTLGTEVVKAVNPDFVVDSLFAAKIFSAAEHVMLTNISERTKKTRELLALLHSSRHPEAFIKLHEAIKADVAYSWLAEKVDDLCISSKRKKGKMLRKFQLLPGA